MAKKLKIPKSVLDLRKSPKKFAKSQNIKLDGKGMSKSEKKHNRKRFKKEYGEFAISGLNKAVKILAEYPEHKKVVKVKEGVENIITNTAIMKVISKAYKKDPDRFSNLKFLPNIIMNTIMYYSSDTLSEDEKKQAESLDKEALVEFCEKILKTPIKKYRKAGLSDAAAYNLATVIPTSKLFVTDRTWYRQLIKALYDIAENEEVDIDVTLKAVLSVDKKKAIKKKEFLKGFFTEFIMQKYSNKQAKFNDKQKDLHSALIERTLLYLDNLKKSDCKEILKVYIKRRKRAEENKNDSKRIIKFIDHANSNSPYATIKDAVQDLIDADKSNEIYLG